MLLGYSAVLPFVFANGVAHNLVFFGQEEHPAHPLRECGPHTAWAETFPEWVEAHRGVLRDAWQQAAVQYAETPLSCPQ